MKLEKGIYKLKRATVFQSNSGSYPVQAQKGQQILIVKSVRGGYFGQVRFGQFKHDVIIKSEQLDTLRRHIK